MKKITTVLFAIFFLTVSCAAQLNKGTWLLGGTGSFSSTTNDFSNSTVEAKNKRSLIRVNGNVSYFIAEKLVAGIKPTPNYNKNKGMSAPTTFSTATSVRFDYGPFLRYYFLQNEKPFNILADLSYQFGNIKFIQSGDKGSRTNFLASRGS